MKNKKLKFKVPVSWEMSSMVEVEAKDLAEAVEVAKADFAKFGGEFLPKGEFVKNSYYVEYEAIDVHQSQETLDKMDWQEAHFNTEGYGIGGHINSKGEVIDDAYNIDVSHHFDDPCTTDVKEIERHLGLEIGSDGTVSEVK